MSYVKDVYESNYWKLSLTGLSLKSWLKECLRITFIGGILKNGNKPTRFLCLCIKLRQYHPPIQFIQKLLLFHSNIYLKLVGIFYVRIFLEPLVVYKILEPYYNDFRKVWVLNEDNGKRLIAVGIIIEWLLNKSIVFGVKLPYLPNRNLFEKLNLLSRKIYYLHNN
mmetsp:Transcript_7652/g.10865  ORF Transcript_7652/g.10865 Transcript_7652/m.10865 type:complete len:166 (-) Transcript_7652:5350-5847(-)